MTTHTVSLIASLGYGRNVTFGPLWNDAERVMADLRRYIISEGHDRLFGLTVQQAAETLVCFCPHDGTGEEYAALACLMKRGFGERIISL